MHTCMINEKHCTCSAAVNHSPGNAEWGSLERKCFIWLFHKRPGQEREEREKKTAWGAGDKCCEHRAAPTRTQAEVQRKWFDLRKMTLEHIKRLQWHTMRGEYQTPVGKNILHPPEDQRRAVCLYSVLISMVAQQQKMYPAQFNKLVTIVSKHPRLINAEWFKPNILNNTSLTGQVCGAHLLCTLWAGLVSLTTSGTKVKISSEGKCCELKLKKNYSWTNNITSLQNEWKWMWILFSFCFLAIRYQRLFIVVFYCQHKVSLRHWITKTKQKHWQILWEQDRSAS